MRFYLINLDRSADRLEWMNDQTAPLNLVMQRVPAVDGHLLSADDWSRWAAVTSKRFGMGPGETACFLSHRRVWQMMIDNDEPWAFIAEDDIHLCETACHFMQDSSWIPADADLVKAETARQRVWLAPRATSICYGHALHRLRSSHGGSAGYFISRHAASKLLSATETLCSIPDQVLFNPVLGIAPQLKIYQMDPAICIQDWLVAAQPREKRLGSLLLFERQQFHEALQPRHRLKSAYLWYKLSNPVHKAGRASISLAANKLGTHVVKKIPFEARPAYQRAAS